MYNLKDEFIYIITKTHGFIGFEDDIRARILLLDTAAIETHLGKDFRQHGYSMASDDGAFGPWGTELKTDGDLWENYIIKKPYLYYQMHEILGALSHKDALIGNLYYACAMARLQYSRHKDPLPSATDVVARFYYYKKYFNSRSGKATLENFIACHDKFVV